MIREILTSQPQQTLQHINPSHQDEPFQSINIKLDLNLGSLSFVTIIFKSNISYHVINVVRIFDMCY